MLTNHLATTERDIAAPSLLRRRRSKYRAVPVKVEGIRFASRKEAYRYCTLKTMLLAGHIADLELQPAYKLSAGGRPVLLPGKRSSRQAVYRADFRYRDCRTGEVIVEDVKGYDTPLSKLKRALVMAEFGVSVKLT